MDARSSLVQPDVTEVLPPVPQEEDRPRQVEGQLGEQVNIEDLGRIDGGQRGAAQHEANRPDGCAMGSNPLIA